MTGNDDDEECEGLRFKRLLTSLANVPKTEVEELAKAQRERVPDSAPRRGKPRLKNAPRAS